jgi:hypothetical protein
MKQIITGLLIGIIIGAIVGYMVSDVSAYAKTDALQRDAFLGGFLTMCTSAHDEANNRVFSERQCEDGARYALDSKYYEQWKTGQP